MVDCDKCRSEMRHTFTEDQIKEKIGEVSNPVLELNYRSSFTCDNCGNIKKLSTMEIMKEFAKTRMKSGKSVKDIVEEIKDKKKGV